MQSALNVSKVNQSLESVRLLASRAAALLDPFALLEVLEQLSGHAWEANHPQSKKFDAIFQQRRPHANSNSLAEVVLQLLGDKEKRDVASQIRKIFKGYSSPVQLQGRPLIFGQTIPTSRVQVPIPEAHLVAVDASDHSTSGPVLIAEELVILLVSLKLLKSDVSLQYIGVSVPLIVCLRYLFALL